MKATSGNLPLNVRYELVEINYNSMLEGNVGTCNNCGNVISNIATIKDDSGKKYDVGCDCAEVLLAECSRGALQDLLQAKKEYNKKMALIRKIKKYQVTDGLKLDVDDLFVSFSERKVSCYRCEKWRNNPSICCTPCDDPETFGRWSWSGRYRLDYVNKILNEFGMEGLK